MLERQRVRVALGKLATVRKKIFVGFDILVESCHRAVIGPEHSAHLGLSRYVNQRVATIAVAIYVNLALGVGKRIVFARVTVIKQHYIGAEEPVATAILDHCHNLMWKLIDRTAKRWRVALYGVGATPV